MPNKSGIRFLDESIADMSRLRALLNDFCMSAALQSPLHSLTERSVVNINFLGLTGGSTDNSSWSAIHDRYKHQLDLQIGFLVATRKIPRLIKFDPFRLFSPIDDCAMLAQFSIDRLVAAHRIPDGPVHQIEGHLLDLQDEINAGKNTVDAEWKNTLASYGSLHRNEAFIGRTKPVQRRTQLPQQSIHSILRAVT